ncbi:ubiquitin carboxyl-terminal hydrolase 9X-like [Tubulanus polymorphus]|uniref:ubiquitin carboxyl-terminal hydrolase 9X-like n=1 Tax=Tubulanus polymorphus TaxID=672921 RepID=UPI003DA6A576
MTILMRGSPAGGDSPSDQPPTNNATTTTQPNEETTSDEQDENKEDVKVTFPLDELDRLDDMINRPRWVVPVLPKGELEVLLDSSIDLCKKGVDIHSEACQRFFKEGLTISFTKILTDEAVSGWKYEIHRCIMRNAERLVELCVAKLPHDWFPLLDLLAMLFSPMNKFHSYNATRQSETCPAGAQLPDDELFARPPDHRTPRGWLVDLVNRFGSLNGFQLLLDRFQAESLSVPVIAALVRPFGVCYEVLTPHTARKYFMPIADIVPKFLAGLTDEELKKESKTEAKNDALSGIIKALKSLVNRVAGQEEIIKKLEIFRLEMILRLLQISSFNGKMNALNEVNKVITGVSIYTHRHSQIEEDEWLTAEKMAEWIQQNGVLGIVLRDSLHQPQYVEKLEKIIRFMIKEKALTLQDLDRIWEAQSGKHEAIVKNVHDLLAKLAWDFSPEQLDHLFECFQGSWTQASKKQREKLLELIRRLAEDDKEGVMAHKVLGLLWNLAHSEDVPTEIMDQALTAHIKILDYSCSQDRDAQKIQWINRFVEELKNDKWVLPALKQIREICTLFNEAPQNFAHAQRTPHVYYRNHVINQLQTTHSIVMLVAQNLSSYMIKAATYSKENPDVDPSVIFHDGRFNHIQQVQERLKFLRFLLKDGQLWLCEPQANELWNCLAKNAIYITDREACFRWFSKLMGEEPDLDPDITKEFFENNLLQLDPTLLTENGMTCFERFFKAVNSKEGKLRAKRRGGYMMDDLELIGLDYLWRVVLWSPDDVADKAIMLLKDIYTNLGPRLQSSQVDIHIDFIQSCVDRLKASYDTISVLEKDKDSLNRVHQETCRMIRVMTVLREYMAECDDTYGEERAILPLGRACRGKHLTLLVRFPNQGRQVEDIDVWSHTNDTIGSVRRHILHRVKPNNSNLKVDLYVNGDILDQNDDKRLISQVPIRDKTLISAKLCQIGSNMPSSPDSSSDSSAGSPHHPYDGPNIEAENCLPGVLMSNNAKYAQFLHQLADLGTQLSVPKLRDSARAILKLMPADKQVQKDLCDICSKRGDLETIFFSSAVSSVVYNLEVTYALLMPSLDPSSEEAFEFQMNFIKNGGVQLVLNMLTKNNFLSNADLTLKRAAYLVILKIAKLLLATVGHAMVQVVANACHSDSSTPPISASTHNHAVVLQQALQHIPNPNAECMMRNVAARLGQQLGEKATGVVPDINVVKSIQKIAWASASGNLQSVHLSNDDLHKLHEKCNNINKQPDSEDISVCRESLEVLTICLALCPSALEALNKAWQCFIIDLILLTKSRAVRACASEQFLLMSTRCTAGGRPLIYFITLLFTVLDSTCKEQAKQSHEYFILLCRLLNFACNSQTGMLNAETLLNTEILWLKRIREKSIESGDLDCEEALLEGHLGVTRELLAFQSADKKYLIGSENGGSNLIKELVEDFIFPSSKIVMLCRKMNGGDLPPSDNSLPICCTPLTLIAAYDLLVALCTGCVPNLKLLSEMIMDMYYTGNEYNLTEWEYLPPVGPRPPKGFVGLKNAGATCYMNSVLQQLFMIEPIRSAILSIEGAADDIEEDEDDKPENEVTSGDVNEEERKDDEKPEETRNDYNIGVLKHIQMIFGHLQASKLQYYVPKGFWKHFKLWGEPVNLREQHDALEFFNSLVDSLDEAMKTLGNSPAVSKVLGGTFADQKICKDCPHRYSREESFTTLNIDIRNQQNLLESLEQYVKGDLLEGANAYHCEKCGKKVDTVKRMCIKKLPPMLAIQLKRFDYDWERECAVKFNDYFEFPRELEMEPYTVQGLAKIEGEVIADDNDEIEALSKQSSRYRLVGVVVHSGQASGGHYYSYILHRPPEQTMKWYKFDDGEVSECKMDDDEEMKIQCFGGEYVGEVFDHMLKRMSYRRQKRWWNAYILIYEKIDATSHDVNNKLSKSLQDLSIVNKAVKMPLKIERCVRKQNTQFMHSKNQFSMEYFQFIRKLLMCNQPYLTPMPEKLSPEAEELAMISIQVASKFLFSVGFHTKKTLRGPANEWYDALSIHLRHSKLTRTWFAEKVLFENSHRFAEYLLECPSSEVRSAFVKVLVFLAHFSLQDGPCPPPLMPGLYSSEEVADPGATLSDHLLVAILNLLKKEVSEHGRHLTQYFHLFLMYANLGITEKQQLLKLEVPATFMLVALDEGPGPPIKYQYPEFGKLFAVVSQLVRCCDVSIRCQSSTPGQNALTNPHGDPNLGESLMPIPSPVAEILYGRTSYVKKLIEDCNNMEETTKLLRFCSWENPHFSSTVLCELLWQVAYSYTYELRPYLDLLLQILLLEDSWQNHRIHNALKGIPEDRDGLFDTIQRSKNHYQKRAYQCIKMMVALFGLCQPAAQMLQTNGDLKRKWTWAVEWLHDELERRHYSTNAQYAYNNWSPPAQSNETSNGYFIERSHSARITLAKAVDLCPEEEPEEGDITDDQESPQPTDEQPPPQSPQQPRPNNQVNVPTSTAPPNNQITNQLNQQPAPPRQQQLKDTSPENIEEEAPPIQSTSNTPPVESS